MSTTGQRIKNRRKELELSADDIAVELDVSRSTIFRYENGSIEKVPANVLEILAHVLRTTPAYLMGWKDDPEDYDRQKEMEFKDKIKSLRLKQEMTMDVLAKKIGVSTPTIQRYESGETKNVRRDKIKNLADALDTTPAYLMGWEDETIKIIKGKIHEFNNSKEKKMITALEFSLVQLNESGLEKVSEYVSDLLDNNKYRKNTTIEEPDHLKVRAAHNDNAADPEQQRLMRQDLQDMEDNW